jgi:lysyl-tRNA synthetase, class I
LLYKRIAGTRHIGLEDIPILMDEYDFYEDIYFNKIKEKNIPKATKIKGIYEYTNNLKPSITSKIHIPYRILIQQSELFIDQEVNPVEKIYERLKKYALTKDETPELTNKIKLSLEWAKEFKEVYEDERDDENVSKIPLDSRQKDAISNVLEQLRLITNDLENSKVPIDYNEVSQKIQTIIFSQSKENGIEPKDFFKIFYKILISSERGPKLGNYIVDLGLRNVINKIENKIK